MKYILIVALIFLTGCSFTYDSRNQNSLKIGKGDYAGANVEDGFFKTGRYIVIKLFHK